MSDTMLFILALAAVALGAAGFLLHAVLWLALCAVAIGGGVVFLVWFRTWVHEAGFATNCALIVAMFSVVIYAANSIRHPGVGIEKVASVGESFERPYEYRERA